MIYAGVGSRETPDHELHFMEAFAFNMAKRGYILRSGGAVGADMAFQTGHLAHHYPNFNPILPIHATDDSIEIASRLHPNWPACVKLGIGTMRKLGRNVLIVLGEDLKSPVDFVACWTKGGGLVGGTAMAIRVARANGIPVFNMAIDSDLKRIHDIMEYGYIKEAA
jgi:hypothetical protein